MPVFRTQYDYLVARATDFPQTLPLDRLEGTAPSARRAVPHRKLCPTHVKYLRRAIRNVTPLLPDVSRLGVYRGTIPVVDYVGCRNQRDAADARFRAWAVHLGIAKS